jgi:hypothetical protein
MKRKRRIRWLLVALAVVLTTVPELTFFAPEAHAIIGRPLTPMSYAGVARRTTRRAVVVGAAVRPGIGW